jgi:Bacterial PH domain
VAAWPGEDGLRVRNLLTVNRLDWHEIVAVRLGGGGPWVMLDLDDGDTLAVMAVQRADGAFGQGEATRLATLVALHSQVPDN